MLTQAAPYVTLPEVLHAAVILIVILVAARSGPLSQHRLAAGTSSTTSGKRGSCSSAHDNLSP
jgi:hypothetical protein